MMRSRTALTIAAAFGLLSAAPALAQDQVATTEGGSAPAEEAAPETTSVSMAPAVTIQYVRPADQRGLQMFEPPKDAGVAYDGFKLDFGAAFAQQFQSLSHDNTADVRPDANGVDQNQLMEIGSGFNLATANLNLNAQLAPGIRVALTTYLSSRHHQEAWVKDGYLLIDESPLDIAPLNTMMEYLTLKLGHFEIDYGDAHYRRTDNGNAIHNPFVGNLIMDAFTTQIGGQVYFRPGPWIVMAGVTNGEIKGDVTNTAKRAPGWLGKVGFDSQINDDLRLRLTGSMFYQERAANNTLYGGDRAGSRYYLVLENTAASTSSQAWSGSLNPGFRSHVNALMINPFVKFQGLEFFGTYERSRGNAATETEERDATQYAADLVYRFFNNESMYVAGRWNTASAELAGYADEVSIDRYQLGLGWFVTPNVLLKAEYVDQQYNDFPTTDLRNGGEFQGLMMEGAIAF